MIIDKIYYYIEYISEILFFLTTLYSFKKFNKRLYSTEKDQKISLKNILIAQISK